jgi:integrase
MSAKGRKRRSPGDGGIVAYTLRNGTVRYRLNAVVTLPDGSTKRVFMRTGPNGERWTDAEEARKALRAILTESDKSGFTEPSQQPLAAYGADVIAGLRVSDSTRASYVKNWRCHVEPYPVGKVPLARLTGQRLTAHYRVLEASGRKDYRAGESLGARTVRYLHTIISVVLSQAAEDGLIRANPAQAAKPPTAKQAKPPEMHCWNPAQLAAFLGWSAEHSQHHALWYTLATTGMRRGEALALRWRDVDLDAGTASVRRSAGLVRTHGEGFVIKEGTTKTDKPRLIDLDAATVTLLRSHRLERAGMALPLVKPPALVFGNCEGGHRHPEHTSRQFKSDLERCRKALGEAAPPECRLHDLRHAHATALLTAKVPVHVVSQRLGHASPTVTLTVYAHVLSGSQRDAADVFAGLIGQAGGT